MTREEWLARYTAAVDEYDAAVAEAEADPYALTVSDKVLHAYDDELAELAHEAAGLLGGAA